MDYKDLKYLENAFVANHQVADLNSAQLKSLGQRVEELQERVRVLENFRSLYDANFKVPIEKREDK